MSMSPRPLLALAFALGALGGCFLSANVPPSFRYSCKVDADCRVLSCRGDLIAIADADARGMKLAESCALIPEEEGNDYYEARQVCLGGLCEYPCDLGDNGTRACPSGKGYNFCFNGACATACGQDPERYPDPDSTCSSPQRCIIFGEDIERVILESFLPSGGSSGGGGIPGFGGSGSSNFSVEDLLGTGVCGVRCDDADALACPPGQYCSGAMCLPGCDHPDATSCAEGKKCLAFGGYSACLVECDATADCEEGEVCVPGLDVCLPGCIGEGTDPCRSGTTCDADLGICVPEADDTTDTSGTSDTTGP